VVGKRLRIDEELELVASRHGGILRAEDVVEFARNPETELHKHFEWDDSKAAHEYRLWQARQVIRVYATIIPNENVGEVRAYVSLYPDRTQPGGGYRPLAVVLSDDQLREQLLRQALKEADTWRHKYQQLERLAPIFKALEQVKRDLGTEQAQAMTA